MRRRREEEEIVLMRRDLEEKTGIILVFIAIARAAKHRLPSPHHNDEREKRMNKTRSPHERPLTDFSSLSPGPLLFVGEWEKHRDWGSMMTPSHAGSTPLFEEPTACQ